MIIRLGMSAISALVLISAIFFGSNAFAASSSTVQLTEQAPIQSLQIADHRYEPITEQQPYEATCSRQVYWYMDRDCYTHYQQICDGRGNCHTYPQTVCYDRPVYRTEYYPCTRYRTVVVGQRLVKTFNHNLEVSIDHPEALRGQKLDLMVDVNESKLSAHLLNSFPSKLLTFRVVNAGAYDSGSVATYTTKIYISVGTNTDSLGKILNGSVEKLELLQNGIKFELKGLASIAPLLDLNVNLVQIRPVLRDLLMFDGNLDLNTLIIEKRGEDLLVMIPLKAMNLEFLNGKKHNVKVSFALKKPADPILNQMDVSTMFNKRVEAALWEVYPN